PPARPPQQEPPPPVLPELRRRPAPADPPARTRRADPRRPPAPGDAVTGARAAVTIIEAAVELPRRPRCIRTDGCRAPGFPVGRGPPGLRCCGRRRGESGRARPACRVARRRWTRRKGQP